MEREVPAAAQTRPCTAMAGLCRRSHDSPAVHGHPGLDADCIFNPAGPGDRRPARLVPLSHRGVFYYHLSLPPKRSTRTISTLAHHGRDAVGPSEVEPVVDHIDDKKGDEGSFGDAPASGGVDEDREEFLRKCDTERDLLTPRETSDCAGAELADEYETEEDGGS